MASGESFRCIVCGDEHVYKWLRSHGDPEAPVVAVCSRNCRRLLAWRMPLPDSPLPEQLTRAVLLNVAFRTVLYTTPPTVALASGAFQWTAMCIASEAGWEQHPLNSQYFIVKEGHGYFVVNPELPDSPDPSAARRIPIREGSAWTVAAGTYHNLVNDGGPFLPLRVASMYIGPHHTRDRVDVTKQAADEREARELASGAD